MILKVSDYQLIIALPHYPEIGIYSITELLKVASNYEATLDLLASCPQAASISFPLLRLTLVWIPPLMR